VSLSTCRRPCGESTIDSGGDSTPSSVDVISVSDADGLHGRRSFDSISARAEDQSWPTSGSKCTRARRARPSVRAKVCALLVPRLCTPRRDHVGWRGIERGRLVQTISWVWQVSPRLLSFLF